MGLLGLTLLDGFITYSMNGFRDAIIHSGTGHLKIASSAAYFDSGDTDPLPFMLDNEQALVSELAAMARVADVMPAMTFSAALETGGATSFVQVSAYPTAQARKDLTMRSIVKGRDLRPWDSLGPSSWALVLPGGWSSFPVRTLSLFALSKGGGLNTQSFTVAGISSSGIAEVDNVSVSMSLHDAQSLLGVDTVPSLIVFLKRTADAAAVAKRLAAAPPCPRRVV